MEVTVTGTAPESQHRCNYDGKLAFVSVSEAQVNLGAAEVRDGHRNFTPCLWHPELVLWDL